MKRIGKYPFQLLFNARLGALRREGRF
jgi:hypothetical protein